MPILTSKESCERFHRRKRLWNLRRDHGDIAGKTLALGSPRKIGAIRCFAHLRVRHSVHTTNAMFVQASSRNGRPHDMALQVITIIGDIFSPPRRLFGSEIGAGGFMF